MSSLLSCPSCFHRMSVAPQQMGRAMPCPLCKAMLVAVESLEARGNGGDEKQIVLIEAPLVLEAVPVEPPEPQGRASLSPVLPCPFCTNDLRVDVNRLGQAFRCPLCLRSVMAREHADPKGIGGKKIVLEKLARRPLAENSPAAPATEGYRRKEEPEIWPPAIVKKEWTPARVRRLVLYGLLYIALIMLVAGVYRQDWVISSMAFIFSAGTFLTLVIGMFQTRRHERDLRGQLRSLKGTPSRRLSDLALALFFIILVAEGCIGIFMAIQSLESPMDFYLTAVLAILSLAAAIVPLVSSARRALMRPAADPGNSPSQRVRTQPKKSESLV